MSEFTPRSLAAAFACMVGCALSNGPILVATFGQFADPVSLGLGWHHTTFAVALTVLTIATMLAYPFVGKIVDRYGARVSGMLGALVFGLAVSGIALVPNSPTALYALFALAGLGSAFPSTVLFSRVVATWFERHRGVMFGLTTGLGAGLGFTLVPMLNIELLAMGWRMAYALLGLLIIVVEIPILFFALQEGPIGTCAEALSGDDSEGHGATLKEALATPRFWLLLIAVSFGAGPLTALLAHMFPVVEQQGFSSATAVAVMTIFAFTSPAWMILLGAIVDRTGMPKIAAFPLAAAAVGGFIFLEAHSQAMLFLGAFLLGLGSGTEYALLPLCLSRYFGVRHYGVIFGACFAILQLITGTAPIVFAKSFDLTGKYDAALHIAIASLVLCTLLMLLLPRWVPLKSRNTQPR